MQGQILDSHLLQSIAEKHKKSTAQIILRWNLQSQVVIIPKSTKEHRIIANSNPYDFALSQEEMEQIDSLDQNERVGPDPDNFDF